MSITQGAIDKADALFGTRVAGVVGHNSIHTKEVIGDWKNTLFRRTLHTIRDQRNLLMADSYLSYTNVSLRFVGVAAFISSVDRVVNKVSSLKSIVYKLFTAMFLCMILPLDLIGKELGVGITVPIGMSSSTAAMEGQLANNKGPHPGLFAPGSWTFQAYGSAAIGNSAGEVYTGHVGVGYFFKDNWSINLEAIGGEIDLGQGADGSAAVMGLDLLLRYYFHRVDRWAFYAEGGAGFQQNSDPFPVGRTNAGTHFNFRPQAGMGLTYELTDEVGVMAGARWLHVSNANRKGQDENPGYDAVMFYSGLMIRY